MFQPNYCGIIDIGLITIRTVIMITCLYCGLINKSYMIFIFKDIWKRFPSTQLILIIYKLTLYILYGIYRKVPTMFDLRNRLGYKDFYNIQTNQTMFIVN